MFLDKVLTAALLLGAMSGVRAATLQYLSMDDMIAKSTAIVRGRVGASSTTMQGPSGRGTIYTHYSIQVIETLKGSSSAAADVAVPGGSMGRLRQTFAGAPTLRAGDEYVFFLWTSPSGLTQIIGLSQGLFTIQSDPAGKAVASRPASTEPMIGANGAPVADQARSISLADLRVEIAKVTAGGSK